MLFREHRGLLDESMETVVELDSRDALVSHIDKLLSPYGKKVTNDMVDIAPYGYDIRIGWNTFIVKVKNYGVMGFINSACN